jgi:hypothetical protein
MPWDLISPSHQYSTHTGRYSARQNTRAPGTRVDFFELFDQQTPRTDPSGHHLRTLNQGVAGSAMSIVGDLPDHSCATWAYCFEDPSTNPLFVRLGWENGRRMLAPASHKERATSGAAGFGT